MAASKQDPLEKIAQLIDERVKAAFEDRDQRQREEKDPWARIEGIVDRAVGKRLAALIEDEGEEGTRTGRKPKIEKADSDEEDKPLLGILGL